MTNTRRRAAVAAVAACLMLAAPALTACSNDAESAAEQSVADAVGGDVNLESGGLDVTSSDGTQIQVGENVTLPSNWPATMPTYEAGTLISVMVSGDLSTLNAIWTTENAADVAATAYGEALTNAGYTIVTGSDAGLFGGDYVGNGYTVNVVSVTGGDGSTTVLMNAAKTDS